jgi:hypothetical protein
MGNQRRCSAGTLIGSRWLAHPLPDKQGTEERASVIRR